MRTAGAAGMPEPALSRATVDRAGEHRTDEAWLSAAWLREGTRVVLVAEDRTLVAEDGTGQAEIVLLPASAAPDGMRYFLGSDTAGVDYFAVSVPGLEPYRAPGVREGGLRELGTLLAAGDVGLLVHAVALDAWHRTHPFCPRCAHSTDIAFGGHMRRCPSCGTEHFPRTDPAVIMLVTDGEDRCLLARNAAWDEGRWSVLAGFVDPGESLEQAVRRELVEEVGVRAESVEYAGSQAWPFPASLMIGFFGRTTDPAITVDGEEIAQARWFSRAELREAMTEGVVALPSGVSIARMMIEHWHGGPLPRTPSW
ncbi:NAD+ diphosphatase [Streptomyces griseochromogenes]|uniref:NAD(+) diphosphatase n=2 Tax=Streptomyces griseochromogenes TaxID=68214 RepID=A0ABS4LTZ6_9ACTN|nr:NAD(+) diphosphatase [Streptomyces griseochromogenes]MBP2050889.1 NAD+ diphosphatase [Streptomyces griseochromogenes]